MNNSQKNYKKHSEVVSQDTEFYPQYHIAPRYGLLNDPNGLADFNGEHHIFYQYHPDAPVHGTKYWYHLSTKDFVHYTDYGIALSPDTIHDKHGGYSGGALEYDDELLLFYTGNTYTPDKIRKPSQLIAVMDKNNQIKNKFQIIDTDPEYTGHCRDPKPWKEDDTYFLILGAQTLNKKGVLVLYKSSDIKNWQKVGNIQTVFQTDAFMYECPDYFKIANKGVLLFSPQGIKSNNKHLYQNIYNVVYSISNPIKDTLFDGTELIEMDKGFDFYAPQTYLDKKGRRILIGWLGISDVEYPLDQKNQWANMLTIPRELSISQGYIIQTPIDELDNLRETTHTISTQTTPLLSTSFELKLVVVQDFYMELSNKNGDTVFFEGTENEYILDRTEQSYPFAEEFGTTRYAKRLVSTEQTIRIFVDKSSIEIFADEGKTVFTSRILIQDLSHLTLKNIVSGTIHYLKPITLTADELL